ncbi:MAG: response regulator transcription factor [Bacteroidales bacterium]|nr:response regulator transcription factor [Bacteroidales bacterium]
MSRSTILIIDDDPKLNDLLKGYLSKFGFDAISAIHPHEGLKLIKKQPPDLIIIDVMMPDMDGFELCREIRKDFSTPIIMLTARGELTDRVVGLELGADDYLPKPFEPRELVARIQSVLRRFQPNESNAKLKVGNVEIFPEKYQAQIEGNTLDISTLEFDLLLLFVKNKDKVLSREQLMDNLHGVDWSVFDRSIDVLVSRLRQKLNDDPKAPKYIKTIRGMGYKFIGE